MTIPSKRQYGAARLAFMYFAPPAAWGVQLVIGYGLIALACASGTKIAFDVLTVVTGVVTLTAGVISFASWHHRGIAELETTPNSDEFLAAAGVVLAMIFFLLIAGTGISGAFLNACSPISMTLP